MDIAYWCIVLAGMLPVMTIAVAKWGRRDYDNNAPRAWLDQQQGYRRRADYAHRNHFEAFPFFAAAVLTAEQLQANPLHIDALALAFIVVRIAYTVLYLTDRATLRSVAFIVGYGCVLALFGVAAFGA
ncbi:MAG: MAPEG family protein [Pseudomonadota bacterium]|nr:MAPEG family protein [Pseudomonadota bacterium]